MSKEQAREFKERWNFINAFIADEIRNTPPDVKLQQLRTVFDSTRLLGQDETTKEVDGVRARWILIKNKT